MGKRFGKRKKGETLRAREPTRGDYVELEKVNEKFEQYYKTQGILKDDEWPEFLNYLRQDLPTTFRITGSRSHAVKLRTSMMGKFFPLLKSTSQSDDDIDIAPPHPIPFYPNNFGWQFNHGRSALKKIPTLARFKKFLVAETEVGNISRQEAVSMIPPLLLDVQPHHFVLDTCAAPGSKTAQLIEALHSNGSTCPTGIIIANEADHSRSHLLIRQTKRLQSPCLIVTNHEAQHFPNIDMRESSNQLPQLLQFDRILCDVPCSGDGTIRKNKIIWSNWTNAQANGLHPIQIQILSRACQLAKEGGRIVYSTCSFNPIENEAVVAAILAQHPGALRLVDVSNELPNLKRRPGLSSWKVFWNNDAYCRYEDVPNPSEIKLHKTSFPPANVDKMNLNRCLRIYPHLQNTGGFFVAVLEKIAPITKTDIFRKKDNLKEFIEKIDPKENSLGSTIQYLESPLKRPRVDDDTSGDSSKSSDIALTRTNWFGEDPFIFLDPNDSAINLVSSFFGINDLLPRDQLLVRSAQPLHKTLYFVSKSVKQVILSGTRTKFVSAGLKLFARNSGESPDLPCPHKLTAEGIDTALPFLSDKRLFNIPLRDLLILMKDNAYPKFEELSGETAEKLRSIETGGCLCRYTADESDKDGEIFTVVIPVWRAKASASLLLDRQERRSLLFKLTGEEFLIEEKKGKSVPIVVNTADKNSC